MCYIARFQSKLERVNQGNQPFERSLWGRTLTSSWWMWQNLLITERLSDPEPEMCDVALLKFWIDIQTYSNQIKPFTRHKTHVVLPIC